MRATSSLKKTRLLALLAVVAVVTSLFAGVSLAVPEATTGIIDDFEDGDASDWGFFGGNNAGGGGGVLADRPAEGVSYFSTGWGGEGTASGFYGGAFKNFDNAAQVPLPTDPWFNVWVLNQSNATVDQYTLEITIREDTDGNGWTNGAEDSFRLDTVFTSLDFDDDWTLVSAPVSSFTDLFTGGDGTFNGDLDEIVIVMGGVQGANPSVIEVDFDLFAFSSAGPMAFDEVLFDDMEHGNPFGNGWFSFGGSVGGGGIGPSAADLPPADGGAFSLETGWGSGGVPGFFGGFGRTFPLDISGTDHFNFWINPDGGQDYTLEINLQDDDNGDGAINPPDDDEFQYNCVVAPGGCAEPGGGWQHVSIPLDDFFDDNSFLFGGNGVLDPTPAPRGGNGQLINIVFAVISNSGADATFRTDYWAFSRGPRVPDVRMVIDDFESGAAPGTPCAPGVPPLGFCTFSGAGSSVAIATAATPPAPVLPAVGTPNNVLQMDVDVTSFAGFIHGFESGGEWVSQDWSTSEGFSLWFHGNNSLTTVFIDVLDNRNPGSTTDDAERWTVSFVDDFSGWQLLEFPFADFTRKEIGNGAPNDGFGLFQIHGWALGTLGTGGPQTFYVDEVAKYGIAAPPALAVSFVMSNNPIDEGTTGDVAVKLNRPIGPGDPLQVSVDFATEPSIAIPGEEYTPTSGTLTFISGGPSELTFPIETFDDTKFEGDERIVLRLSNPVDVELGALFQASAYVADNDPFDPNLLDDFEQGAFLWEGEGMVEFDAMRLESAHSRASGHARPGQDAIEHALAMHIPTSGPGFDVAKQAVVDDLRALLPASTATASIRINAGANLVAASLDPSRWHNGFFLKSDSGGAVFTNEEQAVRQLQRVSSRVPEFGAVRAAINAIVAIDGDLAALAIEAAVVAGGDAGVIGKAIREFDLAEVEVMRGRPERAIRRYRNAWNRATAAIIGVTDPKLGSVGRDFAIGQDWSGIESLAFWYYGTGSGAEVGVTLKDNRAPDPGPSGWEMVWSDEFDAPAGTPPNPANWTHEIGDVTPDGKNGWGNEELQYYTDDPANAAHDGAGNLAITLREADGSLECYYGPCEYTSARLLSWYKAEFAYGRIESRLLVPEGEGIWPAFWSLGTDINRNPWPGAGEIDFMEFVGRLPNEIFGTVHGPGYSGGGSVGGIYDFGEPVFNDFHTFTVEWEPDLITWYVDGFQYHQVTPADVPGPWVFEKPFFFLLNVAIGGNFGGPVGPGATFPQSMLVDYVRVYQGPDTAERFETSFTDDVAGWQEVTIPLGDFTRSAEQPAGAPNDGLGLTEVWGYGFDLPYPGGMTMVDLVRLVPFPPPPEVTVTNLDDAGEGSLRHALSIVADGGTVDFDPGLAGGTISLTSGQLLVDRSVTIDGSTAPGLAVSGSDLSRVFQIAASNTVSMNDLTVTDGAGAPQGGGILNFGTLNLDRVVVTGNAETSAGPANFEFGGGGIYNGAGATLNLTDSTVSDNVSLNHPAGGIYGFFGSTINITRSTVSGNVAATDVAGGLRTLGDATIVNSTFSGNVSTAWHGGAIFHTDGQLTVTNSTFTGNSAPGGTAAGIVVATFGAGTPDLTLTNTIVAGNVGGVACAIENQGGSGTITSGGHNIDDDGTCNLVAAGDQPNTDPLLGALADNGGPTLTHALGAGSPAIDAADAGACPATDQRGIARPQGPGCDVGSFEYVP